MQYYARCARESEDTIYGRTSRVMRSRSSGINTGSDHESSHQLSIRMSVRPGAFLETTLSCKERAIEDRSHSEHTAHDGTCSEHHVRRV